MARERTVRTTEPAAEQQQSRLTIAEVRQLISLMNHSDIEEITIEHEVEGLHLTLRKPRPHTAPAEIEYEFDAVEDDDLEFDEEDAAPEKLEIRAPLVGVFRASMKRDSKQMLAVGDVVRQGQVVAAIEALRVLNEVEADEPGRVREVLVEDGQPVEFGQPLFVLEPHLG